MKHRMLFAALAVLALAAPAAAEPLRLAQAGAPGFLAPRQAIAVVRSKGFDPLDRPMRRGPHYLIRAIDHRDREVTVVVSGLSGEIVSVTPAAIGSQMPPRGTAGGYAPPPGSRGVYNAGAPVVDEDPSSIYAPRPPAPVPGVLPRSATAAMPPGAAPKDDDDDSLPPPSSVPRVITSTAPDQYRTQSGTLPPPPERFPQRAAMSPQPQPHINPKPPVKRAALPKQMPLPKPKPQTEAKAEAAPPPPAAEQAAPPSAATEEKSAASGSAAPPAAKNAPPPPPVQGDRGPADAVPN